MSNAVGVRHGAASNRRVVSGDRGAAPIRRVVSGDRGAAPAEWALVSGLLTLLFLTVLQVGFALHVRTTLIDAAAEGARIAGLRGATPEQGITRTRDLITAALAPEYAEHITARRSGGMSEVTVTAPLPLVGLLSFAGGVEVRAHAPIE